MWLSANNLFTFGGVSSVGERTVLIRVLLALPREKLPQSHRFYLQAWGVLLGHKESADYSVQPINRLENKQLMVDLIPRRQHAITLQSDKTN